MESLLDNNQPPKINWSTNVFRNSRSIDYENRYTELTFGYEDDRVDYLSSVAMMRKTERIFDGFHTGNTFLVRFLYLNLVSKS